MKENYNPNPDDEKKMDALLNDAKDIVGQTRLKDSSEEARRNLEQTHEKLMDDKSDLLLNIEKGSNTEIYYKILMEEIPDLGLSFDQKAVDIKGRPVPSYIAVKAVPFKTDRIFIDDLRHNQVISLFTNPVYTAEDKERLGYKLEKIALLPKGTTAFLLARDLRDNIKKYPDMKDILEKRYGKYKTFEPLSDGEIKAFLRKEIREEYENKFN